MSNSRKSQIFDEPAIIRLAQYIVDNSSTVRQSAAMWGVSKSTIHRYMSAVLPDLDKDLYDSVQAVFRENLNSRAVRGGNSTREMWMNKRAKPIE